jgi:Fe-S cluster assembly protein SufD
MSQVTKKEKTDLTSAFVEQFKQQSNGQSHTAIEQIRKQAIEHFASAGLPANKHEEYKYTPITRALEKQFTAEDIIVSSSPLSSETKSEIREYLLKADANQLVFVNGEYIEELSTIISPAEEIIIKPLHEALDSNTAAIEEYLGKVSDSGSDPFVSLNAALSRQGLFLHVPKSKVVEKAVLVYFFSDTSAGRVISHPRNLYIAEENAQVKVAEIFHTIGDAPSYQNVVSEIVVKQYANLHYYKYENESKSAYHTGTTQVLQSDNSYFHSVNISIQGAILRNNLNAVLDAEHCESHMYGLYMLNDQSHVDNHTSVDHRKPNSFSNELYKGIMDDSSRGVFNGKIYVRPNAQKTNAFQSNVNILMSDNASVDTKPQLEIWADDVKCSHGATTGQLDKEQMFYLRTRGLSKVQARAVLLRAFAGDVIQHIVVDALREKVEKEISERLENQ